MRSCPCGVKHDGFHEGLADALRDAAVNLALAEQPVHDLADVIDGRVADQRHHAGLRIDFDFADMAAVRVVRRLRRECAGGFETELELRRQHHRTMQGHRDRGERQRAIGADDAEAAVLEFDVAGRGLHHHCRHRLGLLDDGIGGAFERIAADMHAARPISAASDRHFVGVALDEADGVDRHAEPLVHHLRIDGLVALAMRMRAGNDRDGAARIEAEHHLLVEHRGLFQEIADAAAAQLAVLLRFRGAFGITVPVRELQALVHDVREVAAVIGHAGMRDLVRHGGGRDEVAPPDLDRVDADDASGAFDQLLDQEGCLGPSGAAIGRHRRGVGQHRFGDGEHRGNIVDAGRELDRVERHDDAGLENMRAHLVQRVDAQPEDLALVVERQFAGHDLVAAVGVADERFRARRYPFHRPAADPARRPYDERILRIAAVLHAEAAADIGRDHAQLRFGDFQHIAGDMLARAVRILRGRIKRIALAVGMVLAESRARLDGVGADAAVDRA